MFLAYAFLFSTIVQLTKRGVAEGGLQRAGDWDQLRAVRTGVVSDGRGNAVRRV